MEASPAVEDESCAVFRSLPELDPNTIHRFVVGEDAEPREMPAAEAAEELSDPFATNLLLAAEFPRTAEEVLEKLAAKVGAGDPLSKRHSFVLGEGSQLATGSAAAAEGIRFVVATGTGDEGPDVIVSAFHPESSDIELMSWDHKAGGFNFYRAVGDGPAWVFAGNSRHALSDPTQGKGPFESHTSGTLLMKELEIPWNNWHSSEAEMPETVFPQDDVRRTHPWFTEKQGAEDCETAVAVPSMRRWASARFQRIIDAGGAVGDPRRVLKQVLGTPTVNLISSRAESHDPDAKEGVKIPPTFFVSANALSSKAIGLAAPPEFNVSTENYKACIEKFDFKLSDGDGFEQKGDTRFAFFVPERAREDDAALEAAIEFDLITPRLAAALLMVDFPNPIFSARREALLAHVPSSATIANQSSSFSEEMANTILDKAESTPEGSPEREFAERWNVGDHFAPAFNQLLGAYFAQAKERAATPDGFDDFTRLAESRRRRAKETMPIIEFPLLFPVTNIPDGEREMRPNATVAEKGS
jgi:hypothetical protein